MSAKCKPAAGTDWHLADAVFTAVSTDRGRTCAFGSWVGHDTPNHVSRYVMPSTARISGDHGVCAVRRREPNDPDGTENNWIDLMRTRDGGKSWVCASRIADTEPGNGNPPALIRLKNGQLACLYGLRNLSRNISVRYSADGGATWSRPQVVRGEAPRGQDLGYCRLYERSEGNLCAVYYWNSAEHPTRHLAATLFQPNFTFGRGGVIASVDSVSTNRPYEVATASAGLEPYIDRVYAIKTLPDFLSGQEVLRTANDDDRVAAADRLRVTLAVPAKLDLATVENHAV